MIHLFTSLWIGLLIVAVVTNSAEASFYAAVWLWVWLYGITEWRIR